MRHEDGSDFGARLATPEEHRIELLKLAEKELQSLREDLALEKSITKWYAIVNGTGKDFGGRNCALCLLHKHDLAGGMARISCEPCVVAKKSTKNGCANTPYSDWVTHHDQKHAINGFDKGRGLVCPECIEFALKELNFLIGFRPAQYIIPTTPRFKAANPSAVFHTTE